MRIALAFALVFAMTGCTYNIAGKRDAVNVYPRVGIKAAALAALGAARKANLSVTSTTSPQGGLGEDLGYTDGMVRDVFATLDAQLSRSLAPKE